MVFLKTSIWIDWVVYSFLAKQYIKYFPLNLGRLLIFVAEVLFLEPFQKILRRLLERDIYTFEELVFVFYVNV